MSPHFTIYEDPQSDEDRENSFADIANSTVVDGPSPGSIPATMSPGFPLGMPLANLPPRQFAPPGHRSDEDDNTSDVPILQRATPPLQAFSRRSESSTRPRSFVAMAMNANKYINWLEQQTASHHVQGLYQRMLTTIP